MKKIVRLLGFFLLFGFSGADRNTRDPLAAVPFGTVSSTVVDGSQFVPHIVMFAGTLRSIESSERVLSVRPVCGDICYRVDSLFRLHVYSGNVTTITFAKQFFQLAPHHIVSAFGSNSEDQEEAEMFMEKNGWQRVAETEIYLRRLKRAPKHFRNIPGISQIGIAIGDTVTIEGVQFNERGTLCTRLVTIKGVLFRAPDSYHKSFVKDPTTSPIYGIKVPYSSDSVCFGGLSGSPVFHKGKVVGIQIACRCDRRDKKFGRAALLIQPLVSGDMMPFFRKSKRR
jgi:hypothetical protein